MSLDVEDPWPTEGWERLDLSDDDVELVVHMSVKPQASQEERNQDLWPSLSPDAARARQHAAVQRINAQASQRSGKPGDVIAGPSTRTDLAAPEIRVQIFGAPTVEVKTS